MNTTTRMGSGLAVNPDRDLHLFADMARQGKHLNGMAKLGHGWRFADGEPEEAVFDLAYESDPSPDYFDLFRQAGWTCVLSIGRVHVFKAAPGTVALHTSADSKREEVQRNRDRFGRSAAVALLVFVVVAVTLSVLSWPSWVVTIVLVVTVTPVLYTIVPFVGYWRMLRSLDRVQHETGSGG